jgi:hypothetical protein
MPEPTLTLIPCKKLTLFMILFGSLVAMSNSGTFTARIGDVKHLLFVVALSISRSAKDAPAKLVPGYLLSGKTTHAIAGSGPHTLPVYSAYESG